MPSALFVELASGTAAMGLSLTPEQCELLEKFARLLIKWNAVHNLTAIESEQRILTHHLLDSLAIVPEIVRLRCDHPLRILDVGAGGGLPGVPLAIACPEAQVTLIEKAQKKAAFLMQVKLELRLTRVQVAARRIEDYRPAQPFDVIVARAFSSLPQLVARSRHALAAGGVWAAMKGSLPVEELAQLPAGLRVVDKVRLRVPGLNAERHLIFVRPVD